LRRAPERLPQDLLAPPAPVERGGVEVVHPQLQRPPHERDAVLRRQQPFLGPPVEPGAAEADLAGLPAGLAEGAVSHRSRASGWAARYPFAPLAAAFCRHWMNLSRSAICCGVMLGYSGI